MSSVRLLRVFLASPGDVAEERRLAREVLARQFDDALAEKYNVVFKVIAWDQSGSAPAMLASITPQAAIAKGLPKPSECDIVVVILWARMGTPLPEPYRKPDGSRYRSGTEWEFLDALGPAVRTGKPTLMVYRRTEPCPIDDADPLAQERRAQQREVQAFFEEFRSRDGSNRGGINEYATPPDFARIFEGHMRRYIANELAPAADKAAPAAASDAAQAPPSSTTTAAFVGPTERGPLVPQLIIGWDDYRQTYGRPLPARDSFLAHAVRAFFDNGGGRACVVRVLGAGAAVAAVRVAAGPGQGEFAFEACTPGAWGNRLGVQIRAGTRRGLRITVCESTGEGAPAAAAVRVLGDYDNLSLDLAGANFAAAVINHGPRCSRDLRCVQLPQVFEPVSPSPTHWLAGGADGVPPGADEFVGTPAQAGASGGAPISYHSSEGVTWLAAPALRPNAVGSGLNAVAEVDDVALLCVPDHVHPRLGAAEGERIALEVIAQCERREDRFALLAAAPAVRDADALPLNVDSRLAALYGPWVHAEEFGGAGAWVPPVGHVAGLYARSDLEHGVHHAPVGQALRGLHADSAGRALEFELDDAEAEQWLRHGINALRAEAGGAVVGRTAITTCIDESGQSVAGQRLLSFVKTSIRRGTAWARSEIDDEALRQRLVADISAFLESLWSSGALIGVTPEEAFFVRCDSTTTTQNDVDNGRVVCLIGLAMPASLGDGGLRIVIETGKGGA